MALSKKVNTATNAGIIAYTTTLIKSYAKNAIFIAVTVGAALGAYKVYKYLKEKKMMKEFTA